MKNEIAAPFGLAMTPCDVKIFNAFVLERNIKKVHEEMVRHIREVEKDLLAAHKERRFEEHRVDRIGRKNESIPIFSRRV